YYLDPRMREHTKLSPPDSPRRQRGELLPKRAGSDWETLPVARASENAARLAPAAPLAGGPEVGLVNQPSTPDGSGGEVAQGRDPADSPIAVGAFAEFFNDEADAAAAP